MPIIITNIDCGINKYNSFKEIKQISTNNLVYMIDCSNNNISSLLDNMNFPNLQTFNCSVN